MMRTFPSALAAAVAMSLPAAAAPAQDLAGRIGAVHDGTVRLAFATRPDVCGDGIHFIGYDTPTAFRVLTMWDHGFSISDLEDVRPTCRSGPLLLVVEKRGGAAIELRAAVGGTWRASESATDLGSVPAREVADWLLDVAEHGADRVALVAMVSASVAADAVIAGRLLDMARNHGLGPSVRTRAMRWMNDAAEREGRVADADAALRAIAADRGDDRGVRERAIRQLRPTADNDAYLRDLFARLTEHSLKERIIRRLGESRTDANVAWVRSVAVRSTEALSLRERAIRVLGELDRADEVRELYEQLVEASLKERVLRVVAQAGGPGTGQWLQRVAQDAGEPPDVRERALRLLGERGERDFLRAAYPRLAEGSLKERVIRILAESPSDEDLAWLRPIVLDRAEDPSLRERALRSLGAVEARSLFGRLEASALRERAVRMVAEAGGGDHAAWLEEIALDAAQDYAVRDRAVRLLGDVGSPAETLARLYDRLESRDLRTRVVRTLADRGDDAAVEKLVAIARSDPDPDMRRYAIRRLANTKHPAARAFLEEVVGQP